MTDPRKTVKLKLEIKGSSHYKFEYEGKFEETLDLALEAIKNLKKILFYDEGGET